MSLQVREVNGAGVASTLDVSKLYLSTQTRYQHLLIGETAFGKSVFLDHNAQSSALDEGIYHAALVHPAMFTHPAPKRVLIGGGGEGATLREVLRHPEVESAVMVDIDEEAVALFRKHLPEWHQGAFDDPRATVVHEDVRAWLERCDPGAFDVVLLDLSDPILSGPSALTFTREFYQLCKRVLREGGVVAGQAGEFDFGLTSNFRALLTTVGGVFARTRPYKVGMPFFCCDWGFFVGSDAELPVEPPRLEERWRAAGGEAWSEWYDPEGHRALYWLPRRLRRGLDQPGMVLTDENCLADLGTAKK